MPTMVSSSVMLRLSQRLRLNQRLMPMPITLVPTDSEDSLPTVDLEDSLPIMDMVPTHTDHTATDTPAQLTTDLMPTMVFTSVMPRLSQRLMLMPTTLVPTDLEDSLPTVDLDTQPTTHMPMAPTHTG